jgi:hypothetical protein
MARTDSIGEYVPAGEMLATEQGQQDVVAAVQAVETAVNGISGAGVYTKLIDEALPYTYIGEAVVGSATSSPVWKIKRIDETNDPDIAIQYAGSGGFSHVWNNRGSETYS